MSILGIVIIIGSTLVVLRYKPALSSTDEENHMPLSQADDDDNTYKPEEIQLLDFLIADDDDYDNDNDLTINPEDELNSIKYSNTPVQLNNGVLK